MSEAPNIAEHTDKSACGKYFGIELATIEPVLQVYCRALTGREIEISASEGSASSYRNTWWRQLVSGTAVDDSIKVAVPANFMDFPTYAENYAWYKSAVTQQVAHAEFGSFNFVFDKESELFENLRYQLHGEEVPGHSSYEKYFSLFDDRTLAARIFISLENLRINFLVKHYYPGLKSGYRVMQESLLRSLEQTGGISLRRAFCDLLETLELDNRHAPAVSALAKSLKAARLIVQRLLNPAASVEDCSEAAIRVYEIARRLPRSMYISASGDYLYEVAEADFSDMEAQDFLGNFNAGKLRLDMEARQGTGQKSTAPMSAEELKKLVDQKVGITDIKDAQSLSSTGLSAADLPRGVPVFQFSSDKYQQVDRYGTQEGGAIVPEEDEKVFLYDEWDFRAKKYLPAWCCIREKTLGEGDSQFFDKTMDSRKALATEIRRQFEKLPAEMLYKHKNLEDGDEFDLDQVLSELMDRRAGHTPTGKVYWKKKKIQRDVAVVFLLDMSGSTADLVSKSRPPMQYEDSIRYNFIKFVMQPRRRIIDLEKESVVLLINAIERLGDTYGIYGFSGHGRSKVQFMVIKDLNENFNEKVKRRIDQIAPIHGTRMGPAIRHATAKLDACGCSLKLLFLVSDGYPQDAQYGWSEDDKEYAIHDTKMALVEASKKNITPFCLTVDSAGNDYLRTMCNDIGYEVLDDIETLPQRLPALYRKLSV